MPSITRKARTLYDKVLEDHIVDERSDGTILLYIGKIKFLSCSHIALLIICTDRHLVHEVTSPVSPSSAVKASRSGTE